MRWALDTHNKPEAAALMVERLKLSGEVAGQVYDVAADPKDGYDADAALNTEGVKNVLKLRAQFAGGAQAGPETYIDLSYYQKAKARL
jgi:hypothetical protein